jgi:hypothetical protein
VNRTKLRTPPNRSIQKPCPQRPHEGLRRTLPQPRRDDQDDRQARRPTAVLQRSASGGRRVGGLFPLRA